jgi:hypothetical protein
MFQLQQYFHNHSFPFMTSVVNSCKLFYVSAVFKICTQTRLMASVSRKLHFLGDRIVVASDMSFLALKLWFVKLY